jgi:hypothetical protein
MSSLLDMGHAYGTIEETKEVIQTAKKGHLLNTFKQFYICDLSRRKLQMNDTHTDTHNPIFDLVINNLNTSAQHSHPLIFHHLPPFHTHTHTLITYIQTLPLHPLTFHTKPNTPPSSPDNLRKTTVPQCRTHRTRRTCICTDKKIRHIASFVSNITIFTNSLYC